MPISKWGPHDRYAPKNNRPAYNAENTTTRFQGTTTPPYITVPMQNTVIPLWVLSFKKQGDTNKNYEEDRAIFNSKKDKKPPLNVKPVEMNETPTTIKNHITNHITTKKEDKKFFTSHVHQNPSQISIVDNIDIVTEPSVKEKHTHGIIIKNRDNMTSTTDLSSASSVAGTVKSNYNLTNISQNDSSFNVNLNTITIPIKSERVRNTSFDFTTEVDFLINETTTHKSVNVSTQNNVTYQRIDSITSVPSFKQNETLEESNTVVESYTEKAIGHTELVSSVVKGDKVLVDNYKELKDKSLEEIQNDLIRLLDKMAQKYHNNNSVIM